MGANQQNCDNDNEDISAPLDPYEKDADAGKEKDAPAAIPAKKEGAAAAGTDAGEKKATAPNAGEKNGASLNAQGAAKTSGAEAMNGMPAPRRSAPAKDRKPRILLLTPSFEENTRDPLASDRAAVQAKMDRQHYPIGIAYLHSYIESKGSEVRNLFMNSYSYDICFEETDRALNEFKPDIIGIQMLTQNRVASYKIIEKTHAKYPDMLIVIGGIHSTIMYEQLIKKYPYIVAVIGEGELTFDELIHKHMAGEDWSKILGIAYCKDGTVAHTPPRPLIENLDILPFPKHELYFDHNRDFGCLLTSRGCPFRCTFCALESITRRLNRVRSIKNVVDEVEHMAKSFPQMKRVWLHDDTFFLNNARAIEFCDEIVRRGLNRLEFVASGRLKPVTPELVRKLEEANFVKILFGLESGTDEILFKARKGITQKDTEETFRLLKDTKMEVVAFLIVGLPGETLETVYSSARFVQKLQTIKYIYYDDIGILMIYPGTEVCRMAKEKGQLTDDFWMTEEFTPLYTCEHSFEELHAYKKIMLDHIALKRFFTPDGFRRQVGMIPYIPKYLWDNKELLVAKVQRRMLPKKQDMSHVQAMG